MSCHVCEDRRDIFLDLFCSQCFNSPHQNINHETFMCIMVFLASSIMEYIEGPLWHLVTEWLITPKTPFSYTTFFLKLLWNISRKSCHHKCPLLPIKHLTFWPLASFSCCSSHHLGSVHSVYFQGLTFSFLSLLQVPCSFFTSFFSLSSRSLCLRLYLLI